MQCSGDAYQVIECIADNYTGLPVPGSYEGTYNYSSHESTTFPLSITANAELGSLSGTLEFSDSSQDYSGSLIGIINPDGEVAGWITYTGDSNGLIISGSFIGVFGSAGGCGEWSNVVGQGGNWQVGESNAEVD